MHPPRILLKFHLSIKLDGIQYREETEFSQEYDVTIKVKSEVVVTHAYKEGLWRFDSARQYDFSDHRKILFGLQQNHR